MVLQSLTSSVNSGSILVGGRIACLLLLVCPGAILPVMKGNQLLCYRLLISIQRLCCKWLVPVPICWLCCLCIFPIKKFCEWFVDHFLWQYLLLEDSSSIWWLHSILQMASWSVVLHFLWMSKNVWERKAIGNYVLLCSWDNCAPQASLDALVYTMHLLLGSGYRSIGAWMTDSFNVRKALWWVGVQLNVACWLG